MLKRNLKRVPILPAVETETVATSDHYRVRLDELRRLPALERISTIEHDLKEVATIPTGAATFHRKKLLRMHDAARLEAGLVTPAQLQDENSPFKKEDFIGSSIIWQPRRHRA